jgi:Tfp pilus assembly protein PilF
MLLLQLACCFVCFALDSASSTTLSVFEHHMKDAYTALKTDDLPLTRSKLEAAIALKPEDIDANQLLGTILVKLRDFKQGAVHLLYAVELTEWKDPHMIANYIESLRASGDLETARSVVVKAAYDLFPRHNTVLYNSGLVARDLRDFTNSAQLLRLTTEVDPTYYAAWDEGIEVMMMNADYKGADEFARQACQQFPNSHRFTFLWGVTKHHQNKLDEAIDLYKQASTMTPGEAGQYAVWSIMGAAYQGLGMTDEAEQSYKKCMPFREGDVGIRNNYGALLGSMNRKEEEVHWLKEALKIDPDMEMALTNLGGYYQDEGEEWGGDE